MRRASVVALALLVLAGCGGGDSERGAPPDFGHPPPVAGLDPDSAPHGARRGASASGGPASVDPVRCPPQAGNCRSASGRILYVERVDPDGDGDAHFVLLSSESVTAPGLSVIDVARELRPRPLPAPGQILSAAGPVYEGSHGQLQIQATEVRAGG